MIGRRSMLRWLYSAPRFRGRDRLIDAISASFLPRPEQLPDGLLMDLDGAEWCQVEIMATGSTEPATLKLFERLLRPGDIVFDVGAHVGHHALVASRAIGLTGQLYAFDPQPYNADRICRNAVLNMSSNIVTVCAACGEHDDFIKLPFQDSRDRSRLSLAHKGPNDLSSYVEVPILRLDTFMARHDISFGKLIKIDVEGFELEVILGLGNKLTAFENIVFEVLQVSEVNKTGRLINILISAGFSLRNVEGKPWKAGEPLVERNVWAELSRPS